MKWAIIGYSSTITASLTGKINLANIIATYSSFSGYTTESIWSLLQKQEVDNTDAGTAIYNVYNTVDSYVYSSSAATAVYSNPSALFPNAVKITDTNVLATDQVLCFAQNLLPNSAGAVQFNTLSNNNYSGSNLETYCDTWYKNNLKSSMDSYIAEKTLTTKHQTGTSSVTAKLFPLAGRDTGESFYWDTYLNRGSGGNMDVGTYWWLRSGGTSYPSDVYIVLTAGSVRDYGKATDSYGVRPAFVLKI